MELENGQKYDGDLLVGADGIWSKVILNSLGFQAFCLANYLSLEEMNIYLTECIRVIYKVSYGRIILLKKVGHITFDVCVCM